ncbi:EVE domain-containing protein [Rathayibacter sp. YIM 133350]|uniref:EVE domain-containing protein n=1 Tax=Rathayibacter sp. YIM 133350 TaxID=3131992 RepID=UPI00307CFEFB
MAIRYWLGVVQRDHALLGVRQGIAQLNHGSKAAVARLREADGFVYYSPRTSLADGEPLREFTGVGRVADDAVYQADAGPMMTDRSGEPFRPWRRRIDFDRDVVPVPIRPLIGVLDFTAASNWGFPLRRGLIEISRRDFEIIRAEMVRRAP